MINLGAMESRRNMASLPLVPVLGRVLMREPVGAFSLPKSSQLFQRAPDKATLPESGSILEGRRSRNLKG